MRTILTERLRLIPVTADNAEALWQILQEPDLRDYQDLPEADLAQFRRIVSARPRRLQAGSWGRYEWLLYLEGVQGPVGWASLRIGERAAGSAEIGYSVVREYRRRGIASEAVRGLITEAFSRVHLRRVRAYCVPENEASRAVLARVGFEPEGMLPRGASVQGQPVDIIGFVLERSRWEVLGAV
ncbi:MAG TPA: GNAT family N-acetyltransferase [Candidatus Baltobacteraceae bacterium]|jgi:RimJ/RimL family protein N-acetyltransferase|nr:GNAT family N-acetyltransferase [Candidatus Baltobacteraceae bacterium]